MPVKNSINNQSTGFTVNAPASGTALTVTAVAGSLAASFTGSNVGGISVSQATGGASSYQAVQSSVDVQPVYFNAFKNRAGGVIVANDVIYQLQAFGFADTNRTAGLYRIFSTNVGANYVSAGHDWWTTSTAGATNQRMVLSANGNVTINAPVSGIALNIVAGGETITAGDLTITSGNVYLPNTTSTPIGVVFQGGNRFIHSFGASGCTYIGQNAGSIAVSNTSNNTTAVGNGCLTSITTGNDNVAVGGSALALVTTSGNNVAMGTRAASYTTGTNNTAIGFDALRGFAPGSASGIRNTVVGANAATQNNNGNENVYIGFFAGLSTTGGSENVVVGSQAFVNANASQNVVIGYQAGNASTGFTACTVLGKFALNNTNTGLYNLMLGYGSGTNYNAGESSNICLHSDGVAGESNVCRIGQSTGTGNRQIRNTYIQGYVNLPGQPSFHAWVSVAQNDVTGNSAFYDVIFQTERYDIDGNYNNTTGVFTAPVTGQYAFTSQVFISDLTNLMNVGALGFFVNGAAFVGGLSYLNPWNCFTGLNAGSMQGSVIMQLTAGDTVTTRIQVGNGAGNTVDVGISTISFFAGQLLS